MILFRLWQSNSRLPQQTVKWNPHFLKQFSTLFLCLWILIYWHPLSFSTKHLTDESIKHPSKWLDEACIYTWKQHSIHQPFCACFVCPIQGLSWPGSVVEISGKKLFQRLQSVVIYYTVSLVHSSVFWS